MIQRRVATPEPRSNQTKGPGAKHDSRYVLYLLLVQSRAGEDACAPKALAPRLDVVIKRKLQRMRTHSQRIDFAFTLVIDPAFDQLRTEDVAFQQEVVICFESFQ